VGLVGSQTVRTFVVLAGREAKSYFHHGLLVLLSTTATRSAIVTSFDSLETLDGAVEAGTEVSVITIAGEAVVLVLNLRQRCILKEGR
jgi:hypothetical protein